MKNTTMKIKCWKLEDGNEVPMPSTATLDGFQWNGRFRITVTDDDGSLGLPFLFAANDTAILTVETSEQEGTHTGNKKIKQILRCVPRSLGEEVTCSRIRSHNGNEHVWSEWEQASSSVGTTVEWDSASCIDSFVTAGVYNITGERLNASDGLPIENSAPGHSISARLTVLNSSITGTGDSDDKCITQILSLSNRTGGDGDVYIRTGRAHSTNVLAGGSGWEPWGKLQQNIEVGQVTSLNSFIGNGIYSGVYTNGSSFFETFVMVVINNYAVAGATGQVRSISQFKYALNVDGSFSYKTRTGRGGSSIEWGSWVDLGAATTTDIQDNSITAQKLSTALQEQINQNTANATKAANGAYWTSGPNAVTLNINKNNGTVGWQTLPAATTEKAGVMSAEDKKTIDSLETAIAEGEKRALRRLFIAAGAEYNDTGADKTKTAPWGETVTHKAGHYYLNGLGDITEEQMMAIYNAPHNGYYGNAYSNQICRTVVLSMPSLQVGITQSIAGLFAQNRYVEVIGSNYSFYTYGCNMERAFSGCSNLIHILFKPFYCMSATLNNAFYECINLESIYLYKLNTSVSFSNSGNLKQVCLLYMLQNASPSSVITITLHPDAYTRLADDTDIVAALEAQPLVSLVSA